MSHCVTLWHNDTQPEALCGPHCVGHAQSVGSHRLRATAVPSLKKNTFLLQFRRSCLVSNPIRNRNDLISLFSNLSDSCYHQHFPTQGLLHSRGKVNRRPCQSERGKMIPQFVLAAGWIPFSVVCLVSGPTDGRMMICANPGCHFPNAKLLADVMNR